MFRCFAAKCTRVRYEPSVSLARPSLGSAPFATARRPLLRPCERSISEAVLRGSKVVLRPPLRWRSNSDWQNPDWQKKTVHGVAGDGRAILAHWTRAARRCETEAFPAGCSPSHL